MPADLKNPFGESCCDGGQCSISHESARPCGCDLGANHLCEQHRIDNIKRCLHHLLKRINVAELDDFDHRVFQHLANWSNS